MHLTAITTDTCWRNNLFVWGKQNTTVFVSRKDVIFLWLCEVSPASSQSPSQKKNCDRQRWQKYIYFVLKVIRTRFTPSCQGVIRSLVLHYSPLVCKLWFLPPSWCSGLSVTSQQEAWVPILMKSILHILKEKHTCSLWALSPKTGKLAWLATLNFQLELWVSQCSPLNLSCV